jgi:integrase
VLKRLHARQKDICQLSFETTFTERVPHKLFGLSDGYQPPSLNGTFRRLMRDTGLLKNEDGQNRTLYSLRHTYATLELCYATARTSTRSTTDGQLGSND